MSQKLKTKRIIIMSDGSKRIIEENIKLLVFNYCIKDKELSNWFKSTIMYPPSKRRTYFVDYINKRFHKVPMIHNVISIMNKERLKIEKYLQEKEKIL